MKLVTEFPFTVHHYSNVFIVVVSIMILPSQPAFPCSKSTVETPKQCVNFIEG